MPPSNNDSDDASVASGSGGGGGGVGAAAGVLISENYVVGSRLDATMTFPATTLVGLGLTVGTYTWTWGSGENGDSATLYLGVTPPEVVTAPPEAVPAAGVRRRGHLLQALLGYLVHRQTVVSSKAGLTTTFLPEPNLAEPRRGSWSGSRPSYVADSKPQRAPSCGAEL